MVVAQKCVDLRAVNKAVIPDRFPLPTSEELIAQFHGSTVFSKLDLVIINFLDSLFSCWGLPNTITTDNGPQLISAEFTTYLKNKDIHHIRMSYYCPQCNGGIERFHQSLENRPPNILRQGYLLLSSCLAMSSTFPSTGFGATTESQGLCHPPAEEDDAEI
ncbi:hypothetical protein QQF64_026185 [Cirrhinus molitorella]|uniref:Integrase catalytic domain-containing protein n=1 Tax=Cirrhinus molitorella TaxID=172907 RepID=A0ABR3NR47_9TELE